MIARQLAISAWLAWRDWKHEIVISLCAVLALASMLSPIMILLGLKNGVIDGMRSRLLEDPSILIITPKSDAGKYAPDFIEKLKAMPGVRFVIAKTRASATDQTFTNEETGKQGTIALEPAAEGEPALLAAKFPVPQNTEQPGIILSKTAAQLFDAKQGSILTASISRRTPEGKLESNKITLQVKGILPIEAADRKMGFVSLGLLEDLQNYRDYLEVPARGYAGRPQPRIKHYPSFRLYASSLVDVNPLVEELAKMRIETTARSREIAAIQNLEDAINKTLLIISLAIGAGFVAFTISSIQGAISRKKRGLAILRLFGMKRSSLFLYPLTQVILTDASGILLSFLIYLGVAAAIGSAFQTQGDLRCHLSFHNLAWICALVAVLSIIGCFRASWKAANVEPSAIIREN